MCFPWPLIVPAGLFVWSFFLWTDQPSLGWCVIASPAAVGLLFLGMLIGLAGYVGILRR